MSGQVSGFSFSRTGHSRLSDTWSSARSRQARRMMGFRGSGLPMSSTHFVRLWAVQLTSRNGPVRVPTGTARRIQSMDANDKLLFLFARVNLSGCGSY